MGEVAVIGAGFVGLYTAYMLARRGIPSVIFEEHKTIGIPEHCTGLISERGLERLGILNKVRREGIILNKVRCATIILFKQKKRVCLKKQWLLVLDRPRLDKLIYALAINSGATIYLQRRVNKVFVDGTILVRGMPDEKYDIVVIAEGINRRLIRSLYSKELENTVFGVQADIVANEETVNEVIVVKLPDYFAWIVPLGNGVYRIGVASEIIRDKIRFIKDLGKLVGIKKIKKIFGGQINFGGPLDKFVFSEKVAGVGDAVGQNKPISGGGVVLGGLSGALLSNVIYHVLNGSGKLQDYQRLWWQIFGLNIKVMGMLSKLVFNPHTGILLRLAQIFIPNQVLVSRDYDLPFLTKRL